MHVYCSLLYSLYISHDTRTTKEEAQEILDCHMELLYRHLRIQKLSTDRHAAYHVSSTLSRKYTAKNSFPE